MVTVEGRRRGQQQEAETPLVRRRCGVRSLDVTAASRERAAALLARPSVPEEWRRQLEDLGEDSRDYRAEVAGDALPLGLTLRTDDEPAAAPEPSRP